MVQVTDRLANERTFLAWIRTAISIIAFGFVVIRFLLPESPSHSFPANGVQKQAPNDAFFTGISFFIMGGTISTLAYIRYRLTDKQIVNGSIRPSFPLPTYLLIAILIICALLTIYFLKNTSI